MNKKFTYKEIGPASWYQYELTDRSTPKTFIVSDNLSTLNVVNGEDNGIKLMITDVDNIGEEITELESRCFKDCPNLTSINLPTTLQLINNEAFKDCYKLSSFKDDVFNMPMYMGDSVFENCNFRKINIKKNNQNNDSVELGKFIFKNNYQLKEVNMDNILLGNEMFTNCSALNKISFKESNFFAQSDSNVFNNCENLTSIVFPKNIKKYYDLHETLLGGSCVKKLTMTGMDFDEVEFAIGNKTQQRVKNVQMNPDMIGNIYTPNGKDEASKIYTDLITHNIPVLLMRCNLGCSYCKKFEKQVLNNPVFIQWLSEYKKCSILYSKRYTDTTPREEFPFTYTNQFGEKISSHICNDININFKQFKVYNTERGRSSRNRYSNIRLDLKNGKLTVYELDEDNLYLNSEDEILDKKFYKDITHKCGSGCFQDNSTFWHSNTFPQVSYTYVKPNDEIISPKFLLLEHNFWKELLNGRTMTFEYNRDKYKVRLTNIKNYTPEVIKNIDFYNGLGEQKSADVIIINDEMYVFDVIENETSRGVIFKNNIFITLNNLYFQVKDRPELPIDYNYDYTFEIEKYKNFVINMCEYVFKTPDLENGNYKVEIETENIGGKCWGVEHDCDVIDKDGNVHKYKYNPPKT